MKKKYILALVLALGFVTTGLFLLDSGKIDYADFTQAERTGKLVQVKGEWIAERGSEMDAGTNKFSFYMKDGEGRAAKVIFNGAKPNNFEIAPNVVAKGRFERGEFHAKEILTKCPSKYEGAPAASSSF